MICSYIFPELSAAYGCFCRWADRINWLRILQRPIDLPAALLNQEIYGPDHPLLHHQRRPQNGASPKGGAANLAPDTRVDTAVAVEFCSSRRNTTDADTGKFLKINFTELPRIEECGPSGDFGKGPTSTPPRDHLAND